MDCVWNSLTIVAFQALLWSSLRVYLPNNNLGFSLVFCCLVCYSWYVISVIWVYTYKSFQDDWRLNYHVPFKSNNNMLNTWTAK